jgi:hypothetical protein
MRDRIEEILEVQNLDKVAPSEGIFVRYCYVDMCQDFNAGKLLSQLIYWYKQPISGNKKTRLRVVKDGHFWIAKTRKEWYEELVLNRWYFDKAVEILEDMQLIEVKISIFRGKKATFIRIVPDNFRQALSDYLENLE